jgi:Tfp pilus assembly protein PilO
MVKANTVNWRLDRRINLSVLLQLMVLASMILASWVNLQRQLDLLQHDVSMLLQSQKEFQQKLELLSHQSISCEYRLQAMERQLNNETTKTSR